MSQQEKPDDGDKFTWKLGDVVIVKEPEEAEDSQ